MKRSARHLVILALLAALLAACTTAPVPSETLASFELVLPESATLGLPFELTVQAVGSAGTAPLPSFGGPIELGSDRGVPATEEFALLDAVELQDGTATVAVVMLAEVGDTTLTASAGGASGSGTVAVAARTAVPGDPGDPLEEAIPEFPLVPRDQDYSDDHPELPGVFISHNTVALVLELGTTVGEANALLAAEGAEIVGGFAGTNGESEGVLLLRLPTADHGEMIARLDELQAQPAVKFVVQDSVLEIATAEPEPPSFAPAFQPQPNGGTPAGWSWQVTPAGGNWGLERIRVPQMWNLNAALAKKHPGVATWPITGILDAGFMDPSHVDVGWINRTPTSVNEHGVHVAGTIHATHDNGVGVDGVNPFTTLRVRDYKLVPGLSLGPGSPLVRGRTFGQFVSGIIPLFLFNNPGVRVVNASLGYPWSATTVNTFTSLPAQRLASQQGGTLATLFASYGADAPIFTVAAGNESNDLPDGSGGFIGQSAQWASPFSNAALEHGTANIIVVESMTIGGARSVFSNLAGHVSAPGSAILSTSITPTYERKSGTSMAAPHVAGLVGYLYALDDRLSHLQIRSLLTVNSGGHPVTGGGSSHVDAFETALDIDRIRGNDAVLRMLLDIDDGTPDGNQRLVIGTSASSSDGDNDGVADGALSDDRPLEATGTRFDGAGAEDADGDGGVGDGSIDMADFRRWRDWLLQVEADADLRLDGGSGNDKRDVNGNGTIEAAAVENVFPRGDFNGDGVLDRTGTSFVPGAVDASVTDLDVLENAFSDPHYQASDLEGLIESMDLTVWPKGCFDLDGFQVAEVVSSIHPQRVVSNLLEPALFQRTHSSKDAPEIYTLALLDSAAPQGYTARVEARDGGGDLVGLFEADLPGDLPLDLGGDVIWDACDPKPILSSVTASPGGITAIPGPQEVFTEFDFTLAFEDAGKNLELVTVVFSLGDTLITPAPLAVDDEAVSGFQGAERGPGSVTFDLLVFCSETGDNPLTAIFMLTDEFEQVSEERTFDIPVDYSGCPPLSRDGPSLALRAGILR